MGKEGEGQKKGLDFIYEALNKLQLRHTEHMMLYGEDNHLRMTGEHETSSYQNFSIGKASRKDSVRIGNETYKNNKGYFEDRRPSANCDPYLVTAMLFQTCCLSESEEKEVLNAEEVNINV